MYFSNNDNNNNNNNTTEHLRCKNVITVFKNKLLNEVTNYCRYRNAELGPT